MNIAVLGAGKVGTGVARAAVAAGHRVRIAGSGAAQEIELLVSMLVPDAMVTTAADAVPGTDIVVLSIPIVKYRSLDPTLLAELVVVDAMNYWPPTDGVHPDFGDHLVSSSEQIARHLSTSRVVKTLNHIGYHELEIDSRSPGSPDRRALAVISDDIEAARIVSVFVDSLGYDPVIASPLALGRLVEPESLIFESSMDSDRLTAALGIDIGARANP